MAYTDAYKNLRRMDLAIMCNRYIQSLNSGASTSRTTTRRGTVLQRRMSPPVFITDLLKNPAYTGFSYQLVVVENAAAISVHHEPTGLQVGFKQHSTGWSDPTKAANKGEWKSSPVQGSRVELLDTLWNFWCSIRKFAEYDKTRGHIPRPQ